MFTFFSRGYENYEILENLIGDRNKMHLLPSSGHCTNENITLLDCIKWFEHICLYYSQYCLHCIYFY